MTELSSETKPFSWNALLLALFHLFNLSTLLVGGLLIGALAFQSGNSGPLAPGMQFALLTGGMLFCAVALVPPVIYNMLRVFGRADQSPRALLDIRIGLPLMLIFWAGLLAAGHALDNRPDLSWLLVIVNVPVIVLPIAAFAWMGITRLPIQSARRGWNMFAIGLTLGPFLILIFEVMAFAAALVLGLAVLTRDAGLMQTITQWGENTQNITPMEAQALLKAIGQSPWTGFLVISILSVLVPIIEEPLKLTGLWLGADRIRTPAEGFALGILSGAGYALFESLGASSAAAANWQIISIARAGTSLLHIVNSGLLGWALVSAWQERKFIRLGLAFIATILIHGSWNALSVAYGVASVARQLPFSLPAYLNDENVILIALATLGGLMIITLAGFNFFLKPARELTNQVVEYNSPAINQNLEESEPGNGNSETTD